MIKNLLLKDSSPILLSAEDWRKYQRSIGLLTIAISVPLFFLTPKISRRALFRESGEIYWLTLFDLSVFLIAVAALFIYALKLAIHHIELVKKQRRFISSVSHELRTPLTTIKMYSEMLANGRFDSEDKREQCYSYLKAETDRLHRLVENVLSISLTTPGLENLESKDYDAESLCAAARTVLAGMTEHSDCILTFELDPTVKGKTVSVNQDALLQILVNLLDNSLKYAGDSERNEIILSCSICELNENLQITVRDFGPGISPEELDSLFKPFNRGKSEQVQQTPGTGLGLALVQQLATAMKATVDVQNKNPGLQTKITLPFISYA